MAKLTAAARKKLPSKSFALPGKGTGKGGKGPGSYPIPDKAHARNALARVSQHGSSEEKARVRAKVRAKFPSIGKKWRVRQRAPDLRHTQVRRRDEWSSEVVAGTLCTDHSAAAGLCRDGQRNDGTQNASAVRAHQKEVNGDLPTRYL